MMLAVRWTDSSIRLLEYRSGITRAFGWAIVCLTTEEFGIRSPKVLLIFALAVFIETIGLHWGEKYNNANNDKSKIRAFCIYVEMLASVILMGLYLLTLSTGVSITIGGNQFFSVDKPIFCLSISVCLYLSVYLAPITCASCWAIRALHSNKIVMRRSLA